MDVHITSLGTGLQERACVHRFGFGIGWIWNNFGLEQFRGLGLASALLASNGLVVIRTGFVHGESQEGVNYRFCRVTGLSLKFQSQSNSVERGMKEKEVGNRENEKTKMRSMTTM